MPLNNEMLLQDFRSPHPDTANALIGAVLLDRYRIDQLAGRGGMSIVYRAHDTRLERSVAVKVFSGMHIGEPASKIAYKHFVQEAFALSELRHPNTLRIFDFAYLDSEPPHVPFQVSEYMDEGTLAEMIRRQGPFTTRDAVVVMEAISGAIGEAHAHGIVHRDVKPSNILFGTAAPHRIVKLADFSVALACKSAADITSRLLGEDTRLSPGSFYSLGWSAPEQIRGGLVGPSADIYGLGLVLAFLLAGRMVRPHKQDGDFFLEPARLDAAMERGLLALDLPRAFAELSIHSCRATPKQRPPNVEAFIDALRAAARSLSTPRPRPRVAIENKPGLDDLAPLPVSLRDLECPEVEVTGQRMRVMKIEGEVTLADGDRPQDTKIHLRFTALPQCEQGARIHLRGLNCFLKRPKNGAPTTGIDLADNDEIEFLNPGRHPIGRASIHLGRRSKGTWICRVRDVRIAVPTSECTELWCFDFASDGDPFLMYRE